MQLALQAGDARLTDTRQDEQDRGITIKSTGISLYYHMSEESLKTLQVEREVGAGTSAGHVYCLRMYLPQFRYLQDFLQPSSSHLTLSSSNISQHPR